MYDTTRYSRSLVREFGRPDESTVVQLWLEQIGKKKFDSAFEYLFSVLNYIYCGGAKQVRCDEYLYKVFGCYPKVVVSQRTPGFSLESNAEMTNRHLNLIGKRMDSASPEESNVLIYDYNILEDAKYDKMYYSRIFSVGLDGKINLRFANLKFPFSFNCCEVDQEIIDSAAIAILCWRFLNPIKPVTKSVNFDELYGVIV